MNYQYTNLVGTNGRKVPTRPVLTKDMISHAVISTLPNMFSINEDDNINELAKDVCDCWSDNNDGYELAKELDNKHNWAVDPAFVEDMVSVISSAESLLILAIKDWGKNYSPKPPFPVGSKLTIYKNGVGYIDGTITAISHNYPASYLVNAESIRGQRIVKFEDAKLAGGENE